MDNRSRVNTDVSNWRALYIVGGIAALSAVIFFRRNWGTELMAFKGFGIFSVPAIMPASAHDWFALLQNDKFVGLSLLDLFDLINYVLVGLIFLALYGALRDINRGALLVALSSSLVGIAVYLTTNQAFNMLALSKRYAAEGSTAERSLILSAGEALLALHNPGGAYPGTGTYISLFLVLVAGLIFSIIMLRSAVFNKWTGIMGILANGIYLLYFPVLVIIPVINWLPPTAAAPIRMVWYILIAKKLYELGR